MSDTSFPIRDPEMLIVTIDGILDEQEQIDEALGNQLKALTDRPIDPGLEVNVAELVENLTNVQRFFRKQTNQLRQYQSALQKKAQKAALT